MPLFSKPPLWTSVKLGRTHPVPAEIHYSSGTEHYWYHGPLWVAETRPVAEGAFSPTLRDPRNKAVVDALRVPGATESSVAAKLGVPLWVVRDVRRALETADTPHMLRIYGLDHALKGEERILATIDQDLIHEAPMVPYTDTEKGARRQQIAMMAAMIIVDAIFLFLMVNLLSAGPAVEYNPGIVTGTVTTFAEIIAIPTCVLAMYVVMARRSLVLNLQVQPVLEGLQDTHSEAVYLVNSEKTPASNYLARLLRLDAGVVRELTEEIARFQTDMLSSMQAQTVGLRDELDSASLHEIDGFSRSLNAQALGRGGSSFGSSLGVAGWLVLLSAVAVAVALGMWAAMGAPT